MNEQQSTREHHRHLLRLAALSPQQGLSAWRAWSLAADPWHYDPGSTWWFPLVWWNLKETPLEDDQKDALRQEYRQAWIRHQHCVAHVGPLLSSLHHAGIRTLLLKGAALSLTVYERPALRPFGDIDILVAPEDAERARELVERAGWVPIRHVPRSLTPALPSVNYTHANGVDIDLHWCALAECTAPEIDRGFWDRSVPLMFGDVPTRALSPSDQLLHVCVHGLRFAWIRSDHWIADAISIVRRFGADLDWDACRDEARHRRLVWQVVQAFEIVVSTELAVIPAAAMSACRKERTAWWEPLEYRAKRRTSHAAMAMQAWCAQERIRATRPSHGRLNGVVTRLQAVAACEDRWQLVAREAFAVVKGRPRNALTFDLCGRKIQLTVDGVDFDRVVSALEDRLPLLHRTRSTAPPDRTYELLEMKPGPPAPKYRALVNRLPLAATATLAEACDLLVADLQAFLACAAVDRIFVHAGVVVVRDHLVLLPGASGSGKSTLVAALLKAGATYCSDEFALIDGRGWIHPYSRPLRLRRPNGDEERVRPDAWRARSARDAHAPALILFTSYVPDGQVAFERLSAGTTLLQLLTHCPSAQVRPEETLAVLRAVATSAPAWATDRPDTDSVVNATESLLARSART